MNSRPEPAPSRWQRFASFVSEHRAQMLALLFSIILTAVVIIFRNEILKLRAWGYLGVFIIDLLGNATVLFPVPSLAINFAGGSVYNPFIVGLVAGVAEPIGELSGYLAGFGGSAGMEKQPRYTQIKAWMQKRGFLTILILAAIPNPLFDMAGMAAGALRFPLTKFLLACWIGKTFKATVLALLGAGFFDIIKHWFGG
ncbi:MAG: VTT domain-containing protein [Anaerolineae bacterium]